MAEIIKFKTKKKNFVDYIAELSFLCERDLSSINTEIINKLDSNVPLVQEIATYLIESGGKRLRPLFTSCSYNMCKNKSANTQHHIKLSSCSRIYSCSNTYA